MSEATDQAAPPIPASGLWQIPLLAVGVVLFGAGVYRVVAAYQPITFEEELNRVERLQAGRSFVRADAYLVDLLKEEDRPAEQRAELQRRLARTIYLAEADMQSHIRKNLKAILTNYQTANRLGAILDAVDWCALGDTYRWMESDQEAEQAYRQALRLRPDRPDRIRRQLLELRLPPDRVAGLDLSPESLQDLDAILQGETTTGGSVLAASPDNCLWAMERKLNWLLEHNQAAAARQLLEEGEARLKGSAEYLVLPYLEAMVLREEGRLEEAEAALRALLNQWRTHDTLWAKAMLLLGRLQQEDDRPQAALSFYEAVTSAFQSGWVYDACILGRAECLAALEQFEWSLEMFAALKDKLVSPKGHPYLDRAAVRTAVSAIGQRLLGEERLELGIKYMRLALSLVDSVDAALLAQYQSRIAEATSGLAERAAESLRAKGAPSDKADKLFVQAAELYLSLAGLQTLDGDAAARSIELAADNFEAAGASDRLIETLRRFISEYPQHPRRAAAMYRLGSAYQSEQQYTEAADVYQRVISEYPRLPDALRAMTPLADCLLGLGGDQARRGEALLVGIVDDQGPDMLFTPQAREYHDALMLLAEYYERTSTEEASDHLEKAIVRLEDAIALYPDDPQMPRLQYMLADAYRQSGLRLRKEADALTSDSVREETRQEADRRLGLALSSYEKVIALLAPYDAVELTELEQSYLRAGYLFRADCLFDLDRLAQALEAYREAAWRYDNLPASVAATMQVVHCHLRMGKVQEARTALARVRWLLGKIPASAFDAERGMSSKEYWQAMLDRMDAAGLY